MDDLLKPQIQDSCRLALPEGLKDLMSDISREVLRAQPKDLLQFITNYLSALLVTRENLTAAVRVCDNVCENMFAVGLEDELLRNGIEPVDISIVKKLVEKHLQKTTSGKTVKESDLISKIMRQTSVTTEKVFDVQEAVRKAFVRHQAHNTTIYERTPDDSVDDVTRAAHHTLDLYRKTKPTDEEFNRATDKIEAAYRAFGVRRQKTTEIQRTEWSYAPEIMERAELEGTESVIIDDHRKPDHITFDPEENDDGDTESQYADNQNMSANVSVKTSEIYVSQTTEMVTASSSSLAGSYLHLPKFKPYCVHDPSIKESEEPEPDETVERQRKDHINVDYTKEASIEITEALGQFYDYEPDDIESESTIEEDIELGDRKVVIDSLPMVRDASCGEFDDDIEEQIQELD